MENIRLSNKDKCSKNLAVFLKTYMPETFYLSWNETRLDAIKNLENMPIIQNRYPNSVILLDY